VADREEEEQTKKEEPGSRHLVISVARVPLAWTVSKQMHNKARSTRTRDKTTGPIRFCHVIEQLANVSDAADSLSAGSVVRWVPTIFQRPLKCEERSLLRWKISLGGRDVVSLLFVLILLLRGLQKR
jgi:hypothetical protein